MVLRPLFNPARESLEHVVSPDTLTPIEAKSIFIQVHLKILLAYVVIDASNTVLSGTPEAFNRVRVSIAGDVNVCRMMDAPMAESHASQWIVKPSLIREDHGLRQHALANSRQQIGRFSWTRNHLGDDSAA